MVDLDGLMYVGGWMSELLCASFTPSIQTLFSLLLPRLPCSPETFTLFAIHHPFFSCPTLLSTQFFTLLNSLFCTSTLLLISSLLILSILVTPHILLKHFISIIFNCFFTLFFRPHVYIILGTTVFSYIIPFTFTPRDPTFHCLFIAPDTFVPLSLFQSINR